MAKGTLHQLEHGWHQTHDNKVAAYNGVAESVAFLASVAAVLRL